VSGVLSTETLPLYSSIKREMIHFKAFLDMSLGVTSQEPPPPPQVPLAELLHIEMLHFQILLLLILQSNPLKDLSPSRFL
jgi:hypothetical protein